LKISQLSHFLPTDRNFSSIHTLVKMLVSSFILMV
jgi:hypothetical protein